MEIEKLPISLDTALEILGILQTEESKNGNSEKYQEYEKEKQILLGLVGSESERILMFDKVFSYAEEIKK